MHGPAQDPKPDQTRITQGSGDSQENAIAMQKSKNIHTRQHMRKPTEAST